MGTGNPSPSPPILGGEGTCARRPCRWRPSRLILGSLRLLSWATHGGTRQPRPDLPVSLSCHQNGRQFLMSDSRSLSLHYPTCRVFFKIQTQSSVLQGLDLILKKKKIVSLVFAWFLPCITCHCHSPQPVSYSCVMSPRQACNQYSLCRSHDYVCVLNP